MLNLEIVPLVTEILNDEPAVAVMWLVFAAKQAATIKLVAVNLLDPPSGHEVQKLSFVLRPRSLVLLVGVEDVLGRRKLKHVLIPHAADSLGEVREVITLGESIELRFVVQPNIYNILYARFLQPIEKMLSSRLGETDSEDFHVTYSKVQLRRPSILRPGLLILP